MGDADYIHLAKKSIHAYVCALELGWVKTPEDFTSEMGSVIKDDHLDLYNRIKTVVHGSNYGMSPFLMWKSMETMFPTLALAQQSQEALFRALPGLKTWQFEVRARAQKEAYLENPWKVRHYFFDVFTWAYGEDGRVQYKRDGEPKVKLGKDSKRATAFLPQSSAGCVMRDTLLAVGDSWLRDFMPAAVSVHDSILLDVPADLGEKAAEDLIAIMTRPQAVLGGLQIGVEVERGLNWKAMETIAKVPLLEGSNGLVPARSAVA
jgi:DNA polymerase I-like protein with 3'-5' exonuclease and polymerase domains